MSTSSKNTFLYRAAACIILLLGAVAILFLAAEYILPILLPFFLAWILSMVIRPLVSKLAGHRPLLRRIIAAGLVLLFVGLTVWGIIKGVERLIEEASKLMEGISREDSGISRFFEELSGWMSSLSDHLPFPDGFSEHPRFEAFCDYLDQTVRNSAQAVLDTLGKKIPALIMSLVSRLPSVLVFLTSWLLSCYYFSAPPESPGERLEQCLPQSIRPSFFVWRTKLQTALIRYFRAYVILSVLTFGEMFFGLTVLKIPYAFLVAGLIALVDFLPLLGAGTVLVPWAIVALLLGNGRLGTGLLIIFGLHTLIRQILEPKLISRELGLHPLASLIAVYAGWSLFGVGGMLIAPLVALLLKELTENRPASL